MCIRTMHIERVSNEPAGLASTAEVHLKDTLAILFSVARLAAS